MFLQRSPRGVLDGVPLLETAYADFPRLNGDEGFGAGGVFPGEQVCHGAGGRGEERGRWSSGTDPCGEVFEGGGAEGCNDVRTLELVFPPFRTPSISSPYKEWEDTLKAVRGDLNLPKLTIRVCFADKRPYDEPGSSQDEPFRPIMPMKDAMHIYASYGRVVKQLGQLEGLGRFFVKVAWPWEWTKRGRWRRREEREGVQRGVEDAEGRIERFVMGEGYESGMAGKGGDGGESVDAGWGGVWLSCWV